VLTHFPPADTYTGRCDVDQALKSESGNKDKERCPRSLMLYGHGDGGGGPQLEMLERLRRMTRGAPGLPKIEVRLPTCRPFMYLPCELKPGTTAHVSVGVL
jgi:alpha-mannosidase